MGPFGSARFTKISDLHYLGQQFLVEIVLESWFDKVTLQNLTIVIGEEGSLEDK
jgi:hypothetical protein